MIIPNIWKNKHVPDHQPDIVAGKKHVGHLAGNLQADVRGHLREMLWYQQPKIPMGHEKSPMGSVEIIAMKRPETSSHTCLT